MKTSLSLLDLLHRLTIFLAHDVEDNRMMTSVVTRLSVPPLPHELDEIAIDELTITLSGLRIAGLDLTLKCEALAFAASFFDNVSRDAPVAADSLIRGLVWNRRRKTEAAQPSGEDWAAPHVRQALKHLFADFVNMCVMSAFTEYLNRDAGRALCRKNGEPRDWTLPMIEVTEDDLLSCSEPLILVRYIIPFVRELRCVEAERADMAVAQATRLARAHRDTFWRCERYVPALRLVAQAFSIAD